MSGELYISIVRGFSGGFLAKIANEPDLPHHGVGESPVEALEMLHGVLLSSWEGLNEGHKLSPYMQRRKQRLAFFMKGETACETDTSRKSIADGPKG